MFTESARVYDALCRHKDYAGAAATLSNILSRVAPRASISSMWLRDRPALIVLREHFAVAGLDSSQHMLAIARQRCPGVPMHEASLVDFQSSAKIRRRHVPVRFDRVCRRHPEPPSRRPNHGRPPRSRCVLVVEPWLSPERFIAGRLVFDSADDPDLKVARMYVTRREERRSVFDSETWWAHLTELPDSTSARRSDSSPTLNTAAHLPTLDSRLSTRPAISSATGSISAEPANAHPVRRDRAVPSVASAPSRNTSICSRCELKPKKQAYASGLANISWRSKSPFRAEVVDNRDLFELFGISCSARRSFGKL